MDGKDPFLLSLAGKKKLFVPYDASGWSMDRRVGQHCSVVLEILRQFSRKNPGKAIVIRGVPRYADIVQHGVGHYFADPAKADAKKVVRN